MKTEAYPQKTLTALVYAVAISLLTTACEDEDPFTTSPEELAEQIRRNTPTSLPPVTTEGLNTMGAWIHPQPGTELHRIEGDSFLFVASGVDRPETALAESLDCEAFENFFFESRQVFGISGTYCRRPEISDTRQMSLGLQIYSSDSIQCFFIRDEFSGDRGSNYWVDSSSNFLINRTRTSQDPNVLSATFMGRLINRAAPFDTLKVSSGRFDVTYGITP